MAADWVFRHAGGCLIEVPPLQLPPPGPRCYLSAWAATWWQDAASLTGWSTWRWERAERGWALPRHLAVGDVIEFGLATISNVDGTVVAGCDLRWYGWLRCCTDRALIVDGGYDNPAWAADAAAGTLAELRLAELPGPAIDPNWACDDLGDIADPVVATATPPRSVDDVVHRKVVVRYDGRHGRTTIRSTVVDVAVDVDGVITYVEVAAEVGVLFPIGAVTFVDDFAV